MSRKRWPRDMTPYPGRPGLPPLKYRAVVEAVMQQEGIFCAADVMAERPHPSKFMACMVLSHLRAPDDGRIRMVGIEPQSRGRKLYEVVR